MSMHEQQMVTFNVTGNQAEALAQFVKRIRWPEVRQNATGDDEADKMMDALGQVREALQKAGYGLR